MCLSIHQENHKVKSDRYLRNWNNISGIENEVRSEFVTVARSILDENGYALPSQVVEIVEHEILEKYWYDPFDENVTPEQQHNYDTARRQIKWLQSRFGSMAKEVPCQWRELTREEKVFLQFSTRYRRKVFIR